MAGKKIKGIVIELGGDATSLNKAIKSVSAEARDTQSELKKIEKLLKMDPGNITLLKQKQELLNESIDKTEEVVKALKSAKDKADADMANGTEVNEKAYRELERQIIANEQALRDTRKEADKLADEMRDMEAGNLRDVEQAADQAADSLEDARKEAATFGDVLKAEVLADTAKGLADGIRELAEETKEYQKIMASLDASSEAAGYTAEQTGDSYKKLYSVLADEQSSATTLANLQALGLSQKDLDLLIDNVIGGWAKYGDSIPIDGLAEAINETVRAGQVTGTFADILNWGAKEGETYGIYMKRNAEFTKLSQKELDKLSESEKAEYEARKSRYESIEDWNQAVEDAASAEDYFNIALEQCRDEAERVDLVMQTLTGQGLAGLANGWIENNEALVESNLAQEEFSRKMGDVGKKVTPIATEMQEGTNLLLDTILELAEGVDLQPIIDSIEAVFSFLSKLIVFLVENGEYIIPILTGIGAGLAALKIAAFAVSIAQVVSGAQAFSAVFPVLAKSIGVLTNPIFLVTALIVGLVTLIATKGDEIQGLLEQVDAFLQGVFVTDWTNVFGPVLGNILNGFFANLKNIWDAIYQIFNGVIDFIRGMFTGDWERVWSGVVQIFSGLFDGIVAMAKGPINGVISLINIAIDGINWLITGMNKIPGVNLGEIGKIPMLAKGGTVWSGSAIVGEAGPELLTVSGGKATVTPLTGSTGKIEDLLGSINGQLAGVGSGGETTIIVPLYLDGQKVGQATAKYLRQEDRSSGR